MSSYLLIPALMAWVPLKSICFMKLWGIQYILDDILEPAVLSWLGQAFCSSLYLIQIPGCLHSFWYISGNSSIQDWLAITHSGSENWEWEPAQIKLQNTIRRAKVQCLPWSRVNLLGHIYFSQNPGPLRNRRLLFWLQSIEKKRHNQSRWMLLPLTEYYHWENIDLLLHLLEE